jgi:hypothetical protein
MGVYTSWVSFHCLPATVYYSHCKINHHGCILACLYMAYMASKNTPLTSKQAHIPLIHAASCCITQHVETDDRVVPRTFNAVLFPCSASLLTLQHQQQRTKSAARYKTPHCGCSSLVGSAPTLSWSTCVH